MQSCEIKWGMKILYIAWRIVGKSINGNVNHFFNLPNLSSNITFSKRPSVATLSKVSPLGYFLSYQHIYFLHSTYQNLKLTLFISLHAPWSSTEPPALSPATRTIPGTWEVVNHISIEIIYSYMRKEEICFLFNS